MTRTGTGEKSHLYERHLCQLVSCYFWLKQMSAFASLLGQEDNQLQSLIFLHINLQLPLHANGLSLCCVKLSKSFCRSSKMKELLLVGCAVNTYSSTKVSKHSHILRDNLFPKEWKLHMVLQLVRMRT